ncbi:effector-associated domain 2-containing protein [Paractinoplanes rishiriensis]|uniref:Effector-associated domain-containing protein n=1 Tax=Paractinoplanes rishiriensis TaxID=1050105 RepID=A0A919JTQ8_9ACTN|nr:helix-turn-helix domain-containing protein [Actinoplanes rishiriensis]GIE94635.1 hypothetical protein Ari01nite_21000 [Actinoplanes rishiriensis]
MRPDDLDPSSVVTGTELAGLLRRLHVRSGMSYRDLERWAEKQRQAGRASVYLSRATLTDALNGRRVPKKEFVRAFVEACEVPFAERSGWISAWQRVAEQRHDARSTARAGLETPSPPEIARPHGEIARLHGELEALKADRSRLLNELSAERERHETTRRELADAQLRLSELTVQGLAGVASAARHQILVAAVDALLNINSLRDPSGRRLLIDLLQREMDRPLNLHDHAAARPHMVELVSECLNQEGGLEVLASCTELLDPSSPRTAHLRELADEWRTYQLFPGYDFNQARTILSQTEGAQEVATLEGIPDRIRGGGKSAWNIFTALTGCSVKEDGEPPFLPFLRRIRPNLHKFEREELSRLIAALSAEVSKVG